MPLGRSPSGATLASSARPTALYFRLAGPSGLHQSIFEVHQRSFAYRDKSTARRGKSAALPSAHSSLTMNQLSQGVSSFGPACVGLAGLYVLYKVVAFIRADADLRLLAKNRPPKDGFEDKVVWITGASQGLGEELAKQFAAKGAYLILSSRNSERLEAVRRECCGKHAPQEVVVLPLDITAPCEDLQAAASEADAAFDSRGIDVLLHNAGASQRSPAEEVAPGVLDSLFELNVIGTLRLTRAVLPLLLARASGERIRRIVVIGSMAGHMPAAGQALYAACKASLAAYFRTLHSELWTRGVRVTMCHPGPIGTGVEGQVRSLYGSSGLLTQAEDSAVVKKRQSPQRVAELVLRATYHGLDSCWIAKHPVLLLAYLVQYWPSLGYLLLNKIGPTRVQSYTSGGNGYDVSIFGKGANKAE